MKFFGIFQKFQYNHSFDTKSSLFFTNLEEKQVNIVSPDTDACHDVFKISNSKKYSFLKHFFHDKKFKKTKQKNDSYLDTVCGLFFSKKLKIFN